jgi:hypothetical protein
MLLGAAAGCGVGAEPPATLTQMMPSRAYSDAPTAATIAGGTFRPAYRFDTVSGSVGIDVGGFSGTLVAEQPPAGAPASFPLAGVTWESVALLGGQIPAGVPMGVYDLIVADPAGHESRLSPAFTSLGVCTTPPTVAISSPVDGSVLGAGAPVTVVVTADDGYGVIDGLTVTVTAGGVTKPAYDCPLPGGSSASCTVSFPAPAPVSPGDTLVVDAQAIGSGGLAATAEARVALVPAPAPTAFSPAAGSTLGGTSVTVTGAGFVDGATEVAFGGQLATITAVSPSSITVVAPARAAGPAMVTVASGGAVATLSVPFTYVPPPTVRETSPTTGPESGLVPIAIVGENFAAATTTITIGGAPLLCPMFVSANRIEGLVPPGSGTVAIAATDTVGGTLPGASVSFSYQPGTSDAGADGGCPGGGAP